MLAEDTADLPARGAVQLVFMDTPERMVLKSHLTIEARPIKQNVTIGPQRET